MGAINGQNQMKVEIGSYLMISKFTGRMYKVVVMFDLMWKDTVLLIGTILMHRE